MVHILEKVIAYLTNPLSSDVMLDDDISLGLIMDLFKVFGVGIIRILKKDGEEEKERRKRKTEL